MSSLSRLRASPGLLVRALVALGAVAALVAAAGAYASGRAALGVDVAEEAVVVAIAGALARRFGIALPGNGFSSYILGILVYATLDRGWPFAVLVGPLAMLGGDLALRRLPAVTALDNAAHLTAGGAVAGARWRRPRRGAGGGGPGPGGRPGAPAAALPPPPPLGRTAFPRLSLGGAAAPRGAPPP